MNTRFTIDFAWKNIIASKRRSLLTMLGIIIGVGSVIAIMAIGAGAQSYVFSQLEVFGGNMVGILPGGSEEDGAPAAAFGIIVKTLTYEDAKEIAKIPHISAVNPYSNGSGKIMYGNKAKGATFSGVASSFIEVENSKIEKGRFFVPDEDSGASRVAVLGNQIAKDLFDEEDPVGKKIKVNEETFSVIGVFSSKGSSLISDQDNQVYVPVQTAQKVLLGVDYLSMIRVTVDSESNIPMVIDEIKNLLRKRHNLDKETADDFTVRSMSQALDVISTVTGAISLFLGAIAAISLLVGGVGIMNIMLVSVTERTREIGLRKAVGAKKKDIILQFLAEAVLLTFVGGFIGIVSGAIFAWIVATGVNYLGYYWEFLITPTSVLVSVSVSVAIGMIFGIYPAYRAAKLNAIESLRYE